MLLVLCCQVAVRAIEIAKELHSGASGAAASATTNKSTSGSLADGSSSSLKSISVIEATAAKHEEIVSRQSQRDIATAKSGSGAAAVNAPSSLPALSTPE
jgi:hypothetical protein